VKIGVDFSAMLHLANDTNGVTVAPTGTYTFRYVDFSSNITQTFVPSRTFSDALGTGKSSGGPYRFYLFDLSSALSGSLDHVQLLKFETTAGVPQTHTAYMAFGNRTPASSIPTSGSASYAGGTRGSYATGSDLYSTASDLSLSVNFASNTVTGAATNFRFMAPATGALIAAPVVADFSFNGALATDRSAFDAVVTAAAPFTSGRVQGQFFGPTGGGPEEAGVSYFITTGAPPATPALAPPSLFGGGVLGRMP
jgi:hypothetical protein